MLRIISAKAVYPGKSLGTARFRAIVLNALRVAERDTRKLYAMTFSTWQHKPNLVKARVRYTKDYVYYITGIEPPEDRDCPEAVWNYLDQGTSVRYAVLSRDWVSKTVPGMLSSGRGRGRVVAFNKKMRNSGIKARHWTEIIQRYIDDFIVPAMLYKIEAELIRNPPI